MINSPVVTTEIYFSLGQDSSKFFKNMLQQIVFSPLFSEMKQHRLQCFIHYVMVIMSWMMVCSQGGLTSQPHLTGL